MGVVPTKTFLVCVYLEIPTYIYWGRVHPRTGGRSLVMSD
jgi:hypothetical protein